MFARETRLFNVSMGWRYSIRHAVISFFASLLMVHTAFSEQQPFYFNNFESADVAAALRTVSGLPVEITTETTASGQSRCATVSTTEALVGIAFPVEFDSGNTRISFDYRAKSGMYIELFLRDSAGKTYKYIAAPMIKDETWGRYDGILEDKLPDLRGRRVVGLQVEALNYSGKPAGIVSLSLDNVKLETVKMEGGAMSKMEESRPVGDLPKGAELVYSNDFSSGKLDDWKVINGSWKTVDGALYGAGLEPIIICAKEIGRNMRVEYTAWMTGAPYDLSVLVCVDGEGKSAVMKSGYLFAVGTANNSKHSISRMGNEIARTMYEGFSSGLVQGKKHRIVAQRMDDRLMLMIDDKVEVRSEDLQSVAVKSKKFGFYMWSGGFIDDVKVYRLPESESGGDPALELAPEVVDHIGFDQDQIGKTPASMEMKVGQNSSVEVSDEPTWIYREDSEIFVADPCARIVCRDTARLSKSFKPLTSGIVEFDILARRWDCATLRAVLRDESGDEVFAMRIEKDGAFVAETANGDERLVDTIEYPQRTISTRFAFKPGRWFTIRMQFDADANRILSVGVLNLFAEQKTRPGGGSATLDRISEGDYFKIGGPLPFKKKTPNISGFSVSAAGETELLFDNVCILGPIGRKSVHGKNIFLPVRVLADLPFPPRKDPLDVKLYSLRNFATVATVPKTKFSFAESGCWYGSVMSESVVNNVKSPKYVPFKIYAAPRYNRLMVRQAFVSENVQMLKRTAYYLKAAGDTDDKVTTRIEEAVKAEEKTLALLQEAYGAFGHAYLNNLNEAEINERFTPAADLLEKGLIEAEGIVGACWNGLPSTRLADPAARIVDCPQPIDRTYPVWKDGQYWKNNEPSFVFYGFGLEHTFPDIPEALRFQPWYCGVTDKYGLDVHWYCNYNYGVGAYNTCNTPNWLLKSDNDVFLCDESGKSLAVPIVGKDEEFTEIGVNFWNPKVRKYQKEYFESRGEYIRNYLRGKVAFARLGVESMNCTPGWGETGHNPSAIKAFHSFLENEYRSIEALNEKWGASYASFAEITPNKRGPGPSGLKYEFQRFRHVSYWEWVSLLKDALHKDAPDVPLMWDFQNFMGGGTVGGHDMPRYFETVDIVGLHMYSYRPYRATNRWLDSLRKVYKKTIGNAEWHAAMITKELFDEDIYKRSGLWQGFHRMMWGQGQSTIWGLHHEANWTLSQSWTEPKYGYFLLRYFSTYASLMIDRSRRMGRVALSLPSVQPEIGILEVTSSYYNGVPGLCKGMSETSIALEKRGYNHGVYYEKPILEKKQSLDGLQVLIIPGGICMPDELAVIIMDWVKKGGTLIACGPPGVYDPFGRPAGKLLASAFGSAVWEHKNYDWWKPSDASIKPVESWDQFMNLYSGRIGAGKVWIFNSVSESGERMLGKMFDLVDKSTTRGFFCRNNRFDIVMRQAGDQCYLYVLNSSVDDTLEDEILFNRPVRRVIDEGLPRPVVVPVYTENKYSVIKIRLAPAEGTLLRLE